MHIKIRGREQVKINVFELQPAKKCTSLTFFSLFQHVMMARYSKIAREQVEREKMGRGGLCGKKGKRKAIFLFPVNRNV